MPCVLSPMFSMQLEFYCLSSPSNRLGFWVSPVPSLWLFSRYSFVLPPPSAPLLWYISALPEGSLGLVQRFKSACIYILYFSLQLISSSQEVCGTGQPKKQHSSHRCCLCVSVSSDVISNRQLPLCRKLASGSESRDILIPESLLRNHTCSQQLGPIDSLLPMAA